MAEQVQITDFGRSFCYYVPKGHTIWVRIQAECRCEVFDRSKGGSDEYVLGVRTQTGLRTAPPSDALDPGYDFWMIFSKRHVYIKRTHASVHTNNPTRVPTEEFVTTGWRLQPVAARPLCHPAEVLEALQLGLPIVARTEFASSDRTRGYRIEYPVKWADGDAVQDAFRVETGPVLLVDPEKARVGESPEFDDFRWTYLDYHSFDQVRCLMERPTSIMSGATYLGSAEGPRRYPPLTVDQLTLIESRLYKNWELPIPVSALQRLMETDHYSEVTHRPATTTLFALSDTDTLGGGG